MRRIALACLLSLVAAACGDSDGLRPSGAPASKGSWTKIDASPLSARRDAHAFALGPRLLVAGGTTAAPCPPWADCLPPAVPPLRDGAIYDPAAGRWTKIADAPAPLGSGSGAVLGSDVYVLAASTLSHERPSFLVYRSGANKWETLPLPPKPAGLSLVAAGSLIVAVRGTQEHGVLPDYRFDPATKRWSEMPRDPLAPSYDRFALSDGGRVLLFGVKLVPNPGVKPSLYRAAAFDPAKGTWTMFKDSEIAGGYPWVMTDGVAVNAQHGTVDGGEVNPYGRAFPLGGIFDDGAWKPLPEPIPAAGSLRIYEGGPSMVASGGLVLDPSSRRWLRLDKPDDREVEGLAAEWVGERLYVWGGASFDGNKGTLLGDGWVWNA